MARSNFKSDKRKKELARKKKQEDKVQRKQGKTNTPSDENPVPSLIEEKCAGTETE